MTNILTFDEYVKIDEKNEKLLNINDIQKEN